MTFLRQSARVPHFWLSNSPSLLSTFAGTELLLSVFFLVCLVYFVAQPLRTLRMARSPSVFINPIQREEHQLLFLLSLLFLSFFFRLRLPSHSTPRRDNGHQKD